MGEIFKGSPLDIVSGGARSASVQVPAGKTGEVAAIATGLKAPITVTRDSGSTAITFAASGAKIIPAIAAALAAGASVTAIAKAVQADGAGVLIPVTLTGAASNGGAEPVAFPRIRASAARGLSPITGVMNPAPAMTIHGGTSTLSGAGFAFGNGMYQVNDPLAFTPLGSVIEVTAGDSYLPRSMTGNVSTGGKRTGAGTGFMTRTSAPSVDLVYRGANSKSAIYVTDVLTGVRQRISANDIAGSTFANQFHRIDFGSSRDRIIEWYCAPSGNDAQGVFRGAASYRGANCTAGYTLAAPASDLVAVRVLVIGDSHADHMGSGNTNEIKLAYPDFLAERLGTPFIWTSAANGTGFLNPVGTSGTYRQRVEDGDLNPSFVGPMDLVVFAGTTNDDLSLNAAFTDAAIQAEVQWCVEQALAQQPNALVVVVGPHVSNTIGATQSRYDAMKAGVLAANGGKRAIFVDNSPAGSPIITAANKATVIGPDGTHFTNAGMPIVGYGVADRILAAIA